MKVITKIREFTYVRKFTLEKCRLALGLLDYGSNFFVVHNLDPRTDTFVWYTNINALKSPDAHYLLLGFFLFINGTELNRTLPHVWTWARYENGCPKFGDPPL